MTLLVSVEEFCVRTGSTADRSRIRALLQDASEAVLVEALNEHGQLFVAGTSADTRVENCEGRFYLPQRPVADVASVTVDGVELSTDEYRWEPGGYGRPAVIVARSGGADARFDAAEATVTYTHGWASTPGPVRSVIVGMVRDALGRGDGGQRVTGVQLGQFSEQYANQEQAPEMTLPGPAKSLIDDMCCVSRHASVPVQ